MNDPRYWLVWIACFLSVVAVLAVYVGVSEWWQWRKERDEP